MRAEKTGADNDGMVMKREEVNSTDTEVNRINGILVGAGVIVAIAVFVAVIRRRRKNSMTE